MMWNYLVSGLVVGATIVLFDGDPGHPDLMTLWSLAAETQLSVLGVSAPFLMQCRREGLQPGRMLDLGSLASVGSTGSPLPPEGFAWVYEEVGEDLIVGSVSGGTDVCSAFAGSTPLKPVHAGELQCRCLGVAVEAFDEQGRSVIGERGELVVTGPMPSMPVGLWGDEDGSRYRASYFEDFPGVWRHGDWIEITERGSCIITGRSDATLNRGGVRMGTAEFYAIVEDVDGVADSLVVHLEDDQGWSRAISCCSWSPTTAARWTMRCARPCCTRCAPSSRPGTCPTRCAGSARSRAPSPARRWRSRSSGSCSASLSMRSPTPEPWPTRTASRPSSTRETPGGVRDDIDVCPIRHPNGRRSLRQAKRPYERRRDRVHGRRSALREHLSTVVRPDAGESTGMDRTWRMHPKSVARAACLAFALLLVLPLALPAAVPAGSAAEVDEEELGPDGDFNNGHGSARGTGVRVGPSRSGFNFTADFAISLADYQNTVARGDSRFVTLGAILDAVADAVDEDGENRPSNLRTDSRDEDAADGISHQAYGGDGGPFAGAVGSQYVRATDDPYSEVETEIGTLGLEGAIEIDGGSTRATTGVVDGSIRDARGFSTVERIVLGGGAVVLEGLEWTAVHRSGAEEEVDAAFSLGSIEIADNALLPGEASEGGAEGLSEAIAAANEVLAEAGMRLRAPETFVNEETGEVLVTPLRIAIGPSEVSRAIAGPLGDGIQPIREPLAEALIEGDSSFGAIFLLFDVVFGAFAGGGELLVEVGGARALTGFQEFDDPFANGATGFGEGFGEIPEESAPQQPQESGQPDTDASAPLDAPSPDAGGPSEAPAPETSEQPSEEPVEEPVASDPPQQGQQQEDALAAPAASPGPTGGQALTAAIVALLVAAGLGAADFLRLRQSQRTIPV
jgi:hypothetical protein